jgi:hypothetical protein
LGIFWLGVEDSFGMEADRSLRAEQPSDASLCKRITDTLITHHHQTIGLVLAMLFPVAGHCAAADAPTKGFRVKLAPKRSITVSPEARPGSSPLLT